MHVDEIGMATHARTRLGFTSEALFEGAELVGIGGVEGAAERLDGDAPFEAGIEGHHDRAETALRVLLSPTDVRVRDLGGDAARVELDADALGRWVQPAEVAVRAEGFVSVEVREFRSGSMNPA